jgi:hypothetical protein
MQRARQRALSAFRDRELRLKKFKQTFNWRNTADRDWSRKLKSVVLKTMPDIACRVFQVKRG